MEEGGSTLGMWQVPQERPLPRLRPTKHPRTEMPAYGLWWLHIIKNSDKNILKNHTNIWKLGNILPNNPSVHEEITRKILDNILIPMPRDRRPKWAAAKTVSK